MTMNTENTVVSVLLYTLLIVQFNKSLHFMPFCNIAVFVAKCGSRLHALLRRFRYRELLSLTTLHVHLLSRVQKT